MERCGASALAGLRFTVSYQQLQRYLKPFRARRKRAELATERLETGPGEQDQVDYGRLRVLDWRASPVSAAAGARKIARNRNASRSSLS